MRGLGLGVGGHRAVRRGGVRGGPGGCAGAGGACQPGPGMLTAGVGTEGVGGVQAGEERRPGVGPHAHAALFMVLKIALSDVMGF